MVTRAQGERVLAAQRAGTLGGPQPPPAGSGPGAEVAAAATLALTAKASADAAAAPPSSAADATAAVVAMVLAGLLQAFDAFTLERREQLHTFIIDIAGADSALTRSELEDLAEAEEARERQFAARARARMTRDLPGVLATADQTLRRGLVQQLLERERRFAKQREAAIIERVTAAQTRAQVRRLSTDGAYWRLDAMADNCWRCRAMAGKVWPWSVLDVVAPPLHMHCACRLYSVADAIARGWITDPQISRRDFYDFDDLPVDVREAPGLPYVLEDLDLMEARFDEVYGAGHEHPLPEPAVVVEGVAVSYQTTMHTVPPAAGPAVAPPVVPAAPDPAPTPQQLQAALSAASAVRPPSRNGRVELSSWFAYDPRVRHATRDGDVLLLPPAYFKRPTRAREFVAVAHVEQLAREEAARGQSQH